MRATAISTALGLAAPAGAAVVNFSMTLDGSQETPASTSTATGSGAATLDTVSNLFSWNISYSGLAAAEVAAHFHAPAQQCVTAGVILALPPGSPKIGSTTVTPAQATDIMNGLWYVNIHTTTSPNGEIRGQVVPSPVSNPFPTAISLGTIHIKLTTIASGLVAPNWGTAPPGDTNRLFVVDQPGNLIAVDLTTAAQTVFLNVASLMVPLGIGGPGSYDERGFLGVAFHPLYQTNGLLYTYTSEPIGPPADFSTQPMGVPANHQSVIREWHVRNPGNPNSVVDPGSTRVLLRIDQPQFNHNAGAINFGPDGMLYIALGDGGGADDKDGQSFIGGPIVGHGCGGNAQNTLVVLGKLLRINPTGNNSTNGQYGIPADNPFVGMAGFLPEIWAYGFRNPFRFSFDSLYGSLWMGDVGQNNIEEVDIVAPAYNYGWRAKEGSFFFQPNGNSNGYVESVPQSGPANLFDPVAEYDHDEGIAVIGGFVYRGKRIALLQGHYVFGELARTFANDGRLFFLDNAFQIREFQYVGQAGLGKFLLGFGQDGNGEVYAMVNGNGVTGGTTGLVLRIEIRTGDVDGNGVVNIDDLLSVIGGWGACPPPCGQGCPADVNRDCVVNFDDLLLTIGNWG